MQTRYRGMRGLHAELQLHPLLPGQEAAEHGIAQSLLDAQRLIKSALAKNRQQAPRRFTAGVGAAGEQPQEDGLLVPRHAEAERVFAVAHVALPGWPPGNKPAQPVQSRADARRHAAQAEAMELRAAEEALHQPRQRLLAHALQTGSRDLLAWRPALGRRVRQQTAQEQLLRRGRLVTLQGGTPGHATGLAQGQQQRRQDPRQQLARSAQAEAQLSGAR
ncbi:hypothetical protein D3C78_1061260 [compost metagenome]